VTAVKPTGSGSDIKTLVSKYGNHVVQGKSLAELDKLIEEIMSHTIQTVNERVKEIARVKALHALELQRANETIHRLEERVRLMEAKLMGRFRNDQLNLMRVALGSPAVGKFNGRI